MTLDDIYQCIRKVERDNYRPATWVASVPAFKAAAMLRHPWGEYVILPVQDATLLNIPIRTDPTLDNDTIELRDKDDRVIGKIINIG